MKKALKLVFVCSAIIFASPSLMGMNSNPISATQQDSDFYKHYPLVYWGSLQEIQCQELNGFFGNNNNSNILNAFKNAENIDKWIDHFPGQYIDLGDNGAFFQVTTAGDGSCFDHANGWYRGDMATLILSILRDPDSEHYQNVFRMIATYLVLDYESNDNQEGAKTILNAAGFCEDDFVKLTKNDILKGLLERLSEKNKDGENEDERIKQSFKQQTYQILLESIPNDVRDAVLGGLKTELEYVEKFLQKCLNLNNNSQLTPEWFSQNIPEQLKEIRENDEDERRFYWYLMYCFVFNDNLRPLAYQRSFSDLLENTTDAHNGREKDYIIKQTEQLRKALKSMDTGCSSGDFKQWLISNVPTLMMDFIITKVNSVQSVKNIQETLTRFLSSDRPIVSSKTQDIPQEIRELSNPYWDLMLYAADKKLDTNQIKRIVDLALSWGASALQKASIKYISTFGVPITGRKTYYYTQLRTSSDPATGIASGYLGASTYLNNRNEIVLSLDSGLVQYYNHGDSNTPPVLVVLEEQHYTRYIYVPRSKVDEVKTQINKNIDAFKAQQAEESRRINQENRNEKSIFANVRNLLKNGEIDKATSADQVYAKALHAWISDSRTYYNGCEKDEISHVSDYLLGKYSELSNSNNYQLIQTGINSILAQDRRCMANRIISLIANVIDRKLDYLEYWAQNMGINPNDIFGDNLSQRRNIYRDITDILQYFLIDTSESDILNGDEWLNVLRQGNEILQEAYALIRTDELQLDRLTALYPFGKAKGVQVPISESRTIYDRHSNYPDDPVDLAQDRRSMASQMIQAVEYNINMIKTITNLAKRNNSAAVFGFNLDEILESCQNLIDVLRRIEIDTAPNDTFDGDEWPEVLRDGNEILQKAHATIFEVTGGLYEWLLWCFDDLDMFSSMWDRIPYRERVGFYDYVFDKQIDKKERLKRFIEWHNQVFRNSPDQQFNKLTTDAGAIDQVLSVGESMLKGVYLFDEDQKKWNRVLSFVYQHNQYFSEEASQQITGQDIYEVLQESTIGVKRRELQEFFNKFGYKNRIDCGVELVEDLVEKGVFTKEQVDLLAFGQVLCWLVKENGAYNVRFSEDEQILYVIDSARNVQITEVCSKIQNAYKDNNIVKVVFNNDDSALECVNNWIAGQCGSEDALKLAYAIESLGLLSSDDMNKIALGWLASRTPLDVMDIKYQNISATQVLMAAEFSGQGVHTNNSITSSVQKALNGVDIDDEVGE